MKNNLIQKLKNTAIAGVVGLTSLISGCVTGITYHVTYDSVPRNAHLFSNGKYFGDTPITLDYHLDQENFPEEVSLDPVECAKEGYIPERVQIRPKVLPEKVYKGNWGGRAADYSHTFFLKSDPNYRPEPQSQPESPQVRIGIGLLFPINR